MTDSGLSGRLHWLHIVLSQVARLLVLGTVLVFFMGWAQSRLSAFHDRPMLSVACQIVLGLLAIALYLAYGKFVERRDVT